MIEIFGFIISSLGSAILGYYVGFRRAAKVFEESQERLSKIAESTEKKAGRGFTLASVQIRR